MPDTLTSYFPTTILKRHLDGMAEPNRQIAALIAQMEGTLPNAVVGTSTRGGFQTKEDFLSSEHALAGNAALLTLKRHLATAINDYSTILIRQECAILPSAVDYKIWGWAVSLKAGNWQGHHVHPNADISGVYYVTAPQGALVDDDDAGKIAFYDPRPRAHMRQLRTQKTYYREAPVPGDLLLFPSWLEHSVPPFEGDGTRICIAFNVELTLA